MDFKTLGRHERVDLRDFWLSEPGDFTPWLAEPENIGLLGEAIDLELEVGTTTRTRFVDSLRRLAEF